MKKVYLLLVLVFGLLCPTISHAQNPFSDGTGTELDPFLVGTAEQLNAVRNYLQGEQGDDYYFKQINDIDLTEWLKQYGSSEGWEPIGYIDDYNDKFFKGKYDGMGRKITGLWSKRPNDSYIGLFGISLGIIENVHVEIDSDGIIGKWNVGGIIGWNNNGEINNCSVKGIIKGNDEVGGIVGLNAEEGKITNCYVNCEISNIGDNPTNFGGLAGANEGMISGCTTDGEINITGKSVCVGGLVGEHVNSSWGPGDPIITSCSANMKIMVLGDNSYTGGLVGFSNHQITDSSSKGDVVVDGKQACVGGLVGSYNDGIITNSFASGNVTGKGDNTYVGGLVGYARVPISYSFACGEVRSTGVESNVGGLVGYFYAWDGDEISYSYASGSVTAEGNNSKVGGLVGKSFNPIKTCYSIGEVKGTGNNAFVGGLVGAVYNEEVIITSCFFLQGYKNNKGLKGVAGGYSLFEDNYYNYICNYSKTALPRNGTDLKKEETFTTKSWSFNNSDPGSPWVIEEGNTSPYFTWQSENKPRPDDEPITYKVTLLTGEGYTIVDADNNVFGSSKLTVEGSATFEFRIKLDTNYDKSNVMVFIHGTSIVPEGGLYSITVERDMTIKVDGVIRNPCKITLQHGTGYTFVKKENGGDFVDTDLIVAHNSIFNFSIKLDPAYNQSNVRVYTTLSPDPVEPLLGVYSIIVNDDVTISAEGVILNPSDNKYHNFTLGIASGINVNYFTPGDHLIEVGNYLYLYFNVEDPDTSDEHVLVLVDGVDTPFKKGGGEYPYYFAVIADKDHTIEIAMRTYTVTLPETVGATIDHGAGDHSVAYGESFRFCLIPEEGKSCDGARVFANGEELLHDGLRSDGSLYYTLEKVSSDIVVTIEGLNATGNLDIADDSFIKITTENGQLTVGNEGGKTLDLAIYSLVGKLYLSRSLPQGTTSVILPQGIYIVQAGNVIRKVSIK